MTTDFDAIAIEHLALTDENEAVGTQNLSIWPGDVPELDRHPLRQPDLLLRQGFHAA
jgi:hypothetical protein